LDSVFFLKKFDDFCLMKKYLIIGLGNPGAKYEETRHNIGFKVLDHLAKEMGAEFTTEKLGDIASFRFKGRTYILLKPSTFMNLSGKAVNYWMQKEKISVENILVVTDDLNIDFGAIRIKGKGSAGGHNGLKDIIAVLGRQDFARFRFGVAANYSKGRQVDYVLGNWSSEESRYFPELLDKSAKACLSYGTAGINHTMNNFNGPLIRD